jgi:hypothetical protein
VTIHRAYPDSDGNPQSKALCGAPLIQGRWRKSQTPDCGQCNSKVSHSHTAPQRGRAQRL